MLQTTKPTLGYHVGFSPKCKKFTVKRYDTGQNTVENRPTVFDQLKSLAGQSAVKNKVLGSYIQMILSENIQSSTNNVVEHLKPLLESQLVASRDFNQTKNQQMILDSVFSINSSTSTVNQPKSIISYLYMPLTDQGKFEETAVVIHLLQGSDLDPANLHEVPLILQPNEKTRTKRIDHFYLILEPQKRIVFYMAGNLDLRNSSIIYNVGQNEDTMFQIVSRDMVSKKYSFYHSKVYNLISYTWRAHDNTISQSSGIKDQEFGQMKCKSESNVRKNERAKQFDVEKREKNGKIRPSIIKIIHSNIECEFLI